MPFKPHKAEQLTDAGTLPRSYIANTLPGMAHFAGTGPADKTCGDCAYWVAILRTAKMQCQKYTQMTKAKGKPSPHTTWACRYFVERGK